MTRTAKLHTQAMALADLALLESIKNNHSSALELNKQAFALERDAAIEARRSGAGEPTISVLHRSAATLALDVGEFREAERLVAAALAHDPPEALADELRDLLEQVNFRRHLSLRDLELNPDEFQFALTGPAVGFGMVASNEFLMRVENVEKLMFRTAERQLNKPFRERGRRSQTIQKEIDLYVSVPRAASFAVTFRIGSSTQIPLFPEDVRFGKQLVDEVLTCFEMLDRGDDESIRRRIDEPSYYRNFIGLVAKIAPDGKNITGIGFTTLYADGTPREVALRRSKELLPTPEPMEITTQTVAEGAPLVITGRLGYASSLEQQNEIRLKTDDGSVYRVQVPSGLMSDIVKPLWDEQVTVRGTRLADGVVLLNTIDPAE